MNKVNNDSLGDSIISDELTNISTDLLEVGLDAFLEDGVLKDIPIVGTFMALTKVGIGIRDKIFAKKILKFLFQLKDIPASEREMFLKDLDSKEEYSTKVGETIIVILDKMNDMKKAEMVGKLFAHTVNGKIDYDMFLRLSMIIEKCFIPDLKKLRIFYNGKPEQVDEFDKHQLYTVGLLNNLGIGGETIVFRHGEDIPRKSPVFAISDCGRLIVELLLL